MKLVELKCKNCGGLLKVEEGTVDIHCGYCQTDYKLDDEVQHVKYDEMEQTGYDFEKGRIKAKQEHEEELARQKVEAQQAAIKAERTAKNKKWIILAWIFLFPFMLTYWIWAKSKMSTKAKVITTCILWIMFFIVAASSPDSSTTNTATTNNTESSKTDNDTRVFTATYVLEGGKTGDYGRIVTLNKDSDMPVDKYLYKVPAGKYVASTTNAKMSAFSIVKDAIAIDEDNGQYPEYLELVGQGQYLLTAGDNDFNGHATKQVEVQIAEDESISIPGDEDIILKKYE